MRRRSTLFEICLRPPPNPRFVRVDLSTPSVSGDRLRDFERFAPNRFVRVDLSTFQFRNASALLMGLCPKPRRGIRSRRFIDAFREQSSSVTGSGKTERFPGRSTRHIEVVNMVRAHRRGMTWREVSKSVANCERPRSTELAAKPCRCGSGSIESPAMDLDPRASEAPRCELRRVAPDVEAAGIAAPSELPELYAVVPTRSRVIRRLRRAGRWLLLLDGDAGGRAVAWRFLHFRSDAAGVGVVTVGKSQYGRDPAHGAAAPHGATLSARG
jgi:hypothetical protein